MVHIEAEMSPQFASRNVKNLIDTLLFIFLKPDIRLTLKRLRDAQQGRRVETFCRRMINLVSDLENPLLCKNINLVYI